jgi:hypothetical protein
VATSSPPSKALPVVRRRVEPKDLRSSRVKKIPAWR